MTPIKRTAMRLRARREELGMSQAELAKLAGISREYLGRLERARQDPTLGTLEKLAKALKVKVAELVK
jgi:transcriptional regulator with XRE-family HTH domain